jgi:hypothetical protein
MVEVGGKSGIPVIGKFPYIFFCAFVPARHMMKNNNPGVWAHAQGTSQISLDDIVIVPSQADGLSYHAFIHWWPPQYSVRNGTGV